MKGKQITKKTAWMALRIGGEYEKTHRGVPIVILQFPKNLRPHSFCYMAKRKVWRGFYPYTRKGEYWPGGGEQVKKDFKTDEELIAFVKQKMESQNETDI